ncbi:hypothetical protein AMJ49_06865 [Parcubacteria bacterium DG_74_2]|nr:MAG: hypothetical protein AMJ49_06865 [Parcubacteria bacterium DG_74_2]
MNISIKPEVAFREEADGKGILYFRNEVFKINKTSVYIWEKLQGKENTEVEELVDIVAKKYNISKAIVRQDMVKFFKKMEGQGLIVIGGIKI